MGRQKIGKAHLPQPLAVRARSMAADAQASLQSAPRKSAMPAQPGMASSVPVIEGSYCRSGSPIADLSDFAHIGRFGDIDAGQFHA